MEEQRKKRKDTDQDDGPEEEEVILFTLVKTIVLRLCLWLGSHKREAGETVRITGKCKARSKERLKKEIALCKDFNKYFEDSFIKSFLVLRYGKKYFEIIKRNKEHRRKWNQGYWIYVFYTCCEALEEAFQGVQIR